MGKFIDLTGQRFGGLIVLERFGRNKDKRILWKCICDCGKIAIASGKNLKMGHAKSCGCLKKKIPEIHGECLNNKTSKEYKALYCIKTRCDNPNYSQYKDYGGRGIGYCERWKYFKNFLEDMGRAPGPEYSIDRIDNNGDYCKENCRWATPKQQGNNRNNNVRFDFNNESLTVPEWSRKYGINKNTLFFRLTQLGWSIEKALTTPVRAHNRKKK